MDIRCRRGIKLSVREVHDNLLSEKFHFLNAPCPSPLPNEQYFATQHLRQSQIAIDSMKK